MRYYIVDSEGNVSRTDDREVAISHSMDDMTCAIDTETQRVIYEGQEVEEDIPEAKFLPAAGDDIDENDL